PRPPLSSPPRRQSPTRTGRTFRWRRPGMLPRAYTASIAVLTRHARAWASLSFVDTRSCGRSRVVLGLRSSRGDVAERRVETLAIVEHLDVIEEGGVQLCVGRPGLAVDELVLQRAEEALGDGVVPAISLAAHADLDAGLGESLAVGAARVLASPVRMMEQPRRRIP